MGAEGRNAINAAKSATSLGTVPKANAHMEEEVMARIRAATVVVMEGLVEVKPVTRAEVRCSVTNDFWAWLTSCRLRPYEQGLHTGPEMLQLYENLRRQLECQS